MSGTVGRPPQTNFDQISKRMDETADNLKDSAKKEMKKAGQDVRHAGDHAAQAGAHLLGAGANALFATGKTLEGVGRTAEAAGHAAAAGAIGTVGVVAAEKWIVAKSVALVVVRTDPIAERAVLGNWPAESDAGRPHSVRSRVDFRASGKFGCRCNALYVDQSTERVPVTAREEVPFDQRARAVVYMSSEVHHSMVKALRIAGMGGAVFREVPTDDWSHL